MNKFKTLLAALILNFALASHANAVNARVNIFTGNDFNEVSEAIKIGYVSGVIDTIGKMLVLSDVGVSGHPFFEGVAQCVGSMKTMQALAVVEKHMEENPQDWHKAMSMSVMQALFESCEK